MQLVAPAGVVPVLLAEHHALRRRHARMPARIAAYLVAQRRHRIPLQPGAVVPAFDRRHSQRDRSLAQRVLVLPRRQLLQRLLQFAAHRWRGQQRADHRKPESCPLIAV